MSFFPFQYICIKGLHNGNSLNIQDYVQNWEKIGESGKMQQCNIETFLEEITSFRKFYLVFYKMLKMDVIHKSFPY